MPDTALTRVYGIQEELGELLASGGAEALARDMPDSWIEDLAVAGDPDGCVVKLRRLLDDGSDAVGLWQFPADNADDIATLTARDVLPRQ